MNGATACSRRFVCTRASVCDEAGEAETFAERHAQWALALAEEERGSPRLDREAANLRAALDTLLARIPGEALRLCVALGPFWLRRIDLHEAQRRFDQVLAGAPERTAVRAEALLAAAAIDFRSGDVTSGLARAEESYAVAFEIGDARAECRALQILGEFGVARDAADVAMPWLERALELARREGFAAAEATCVYSLGVVQWILGDLAGAEELLGQSVELFGALAGSPERIPSLQHRGDPSQPSGSHGVRLVFEDTLQPFVEISCDAAVSYVLANQAGIVRARGDLARARTLLDESAARFEDSGDEAGMSAVLVRRAYLELADGDLPAARSALEQALELRRRQGDRRGLGLVLAGLGLIDTPAGDYPSAERRLAEARELFRRAGDRWGLASALWRTADLALARGSLDDAEAALLEARAVARRYTAGALDREHTRRAGRGRRAPRRDVERAADLFAEARERYASRDDAAGVADIDTAAARASSALLRGR